MKKLALFLALSIASTANAYPGEWRGRSRKPIKTAPMSAEEARYAPQGYYRALHHGPDYEAQRCGAPYVEPTIHVQFKIIGSYVYARSDENEHAGQPLDRLSCNRVGVGVYTCDSNIYSHSPTGAWMHQRIVMSAGDLVVAFEIHNGESVCMIRYE